jgi:hypothetical protein
VTMRPLAKVKVRIGDTSMLRSRVAITEPIRLTSAPGPGLPHSGGGAMYWFAVFFASIGAALILGALTYVSLLIGVLINFMIILMSGPLVDRFLAKRGRRSV